MKPLKQAVLIFLALMLVVFVVDYVWRLRREHRQDPHIIAAAKKHAVDPALVKAVIWQESRFDPEARGGKGEIGLMQIMPDTGLEWAGAQRVANFSEFILTDPSRNIECGTWYLGKLLKRYPKTDNPVPYALADYNAGRGNVLKWMTGSATTNSSDFIARIGFPSTRKYVRSVIGRRERYVAWARSEQQEK